MNKEAKKLINKTPQKKSDPLFIEVAGNPWFLTNPNFVGFYVQDSNSDAAEAVVKKKSGF